MRIFVAPSDLRVGALTIRGDEHRYLSRARRAAVGDTVDLVDGEGHRAHARIDAITDDTTTFHVFQPYAIPTMLPFVRVLLPLIKGDRMDFALEKLVEVGVDEIVVWPAARSVVKLDAKRDARIAKYQHAMQAAARQSGRALVPSVMWADSLHAAIAASDAGNVAEPDPTLWFVLDPSSDVSLVDALATFIATDYDGRTEVTFVSGPEGGLSPEELALLGAFTSIGLGSRILRAETAPIAAVSIVRALTRS